MSAAPIDVTAGAATWKLPSRGRVGMLCLILAESAIFAIFIAAYIFYIGKSLSGPAPRQILIVPVYTSIGLWLSSFTIHAAVSALGKGKTAMFAGLWFVTLALGAFFIAGTAREWHHLIYQENFTITTNLFGTTYYALVGLHATHVIIGLIALAVVMIFALFGKVKPEHHERCEILSLYWHFVDIVWVVVFLVVYNFS
ncbi:MAG TPA: heme-copper oxidase subunit III [Candidatus Baltobacteraceae bacterium]|nr:heme-copper oxidase subunit III [Candidatus Baltobacteraceae bacterium]